jgi:hypothetical protein
MFRLRVFLVVIALLWSSRANAQIPEVTPQIDADTDRVHIPGSGITLAKGNKIEVAFSPYFTFRYLSQKGMDTRYTDDFGRSRNLKRRDDAQLQKVTLYFKGWILDPKIRYSLYTWTTNVSQGQGAQVVVNGNLQYKMNNHFAPGVGVSGLPCTRSLYGQWPAWLRQDARPMAEEFFRASFTTGVWSSGEITKGLYYKSMLGNNLSQMGIDANQLDNGFDTWSTAVWWTTNNFGRYGSYGDFEKHDKPATILGASFTRSNETRQSQPDADDPENTQIRLSDGTPVFSMNAFNTTGQVLAALYQMASMNGGIKYHGFSLDGEYFMRWVNQFETSGFVPVSHLFDKGFTVQASGMIIGKTLQVYGNYSYVDGEYGKPWEVNAGINWYVFCNRIMRFNGEVIHTNRSPVGYLSYPTTVGSNGTIFMINLEIYY